MCIKKICLFRNYNISKNIIIICWRNYKQKYKGEIPMKKVIYLLLICIVFCFTGCNSKEEAMAIITEVPCEVAGIRFSLNGFRNT